MLIQNISGVRGLVGTHLTPRKARRYAEAVHSLQPNGVIIVGRDSRPSGHEIVMGIVDKLIQLGRDVIDCGIVPTPTIQFLVGKTDSAGGIIVTASHNPIEWNGLKFVREDGIFLYPKECEELFSFVDDHLKKEPSQANGMYWKDKNSIQKHIIHTVSLNCININRIRRRKFKVVIDAVNGAGAVALPAMLEALGCDVVPLNCEPSGEFTRGTEPLPENLTDLCQSVITNSADVGFAVDPDADRLAVVSEKGVPLGEEYTLVLAGEGYMKKMGTSETFVVNLSTSMALEKTAEKYKCRVERTPVGEINVVEKMIELKAKFGGEGNGGVILKEAHLGRDSLVGVTMVLSRMAQSKKPLSEIYSALPQFKIVKDKINLGDMDVESVLKNVREKYSDVETNDKDGLRFTWDDRWVHLRKSNTEPILRIYAEAPKISEAQNLVESVKSTLQHKQ